MRIEHCFADGKKMSDEVFLSKRKTVELNKNRSIFSSIFSKNDMKLEHASREEKLKLSELSR